MPVSSTAGMNASPSTGSSAHATSLVVTVMSCCSSGALGTSNRQPSTQSVTAVVCGRRTR